MKSLHEGSVRVATYGPPIGTGALWENAVRAGRNRTMGCEPVLFGGRPRDWPVALRARIRRCRCARGSPVDRRLSRGGSCGCCGWEGDCPGCASGLLRARGVRGGQGPLGGAVKSSPEDLEALAASLLPTDRVALEVTGSAWEIVRILEPRVAEVVVLEGKVPQLSANCGFVSSLRARLAREPPCGQASRLHSGHVADAAGSPPEDACAT
jgi:hypothetical protein